MGEILTNTSAVHEDTAISKSSINALRCCSSSKWFNIITGFWKRASSPEIHVAMPMALGRSLSTDSLGVINPYKSCMKSSRGHYDSDVDGLSSSDDEALANGTAANGRSNSVGA